jgi:hypothetical protein
MGRSGNDITRSTIKVRKHRTPQQHTPFLSLYPQMYLQYANMKKKHLQHFTRIPNRKKLHKATDITNAGYLMVTMVDYVTNEKAVRKWLQQNVKDGAWVNVFKNFYFANDQDAVLFKLTWG